MSAGLVSATITEQVVLTVLSCDCCGRKAKYYPSYLKFEDLKKHRAATAPNVTDDDIDRWMRVPGSEGCGDIDFCEACKDAVVLSAKRMVRPVEQPPTHDPRDDHSIGCGKRWTLQAETCTCDDRYPGGFRLP